jgi:hypothetical protein
MDEHVIEEIKEMPKDELIESILSHRGDHIGIDYITIDDLFNYCKDNNFTMIDSNDLELIIEDIVKQEEKAYEGSEAQEMDELIDDLVRGDRDHRVATAEHVVRELYRGYEEIKSLREENKKLKEGQN